MGKRRHITADRTGNFQPVEGGVAIQVVENEEPRQGTIGGLSVLRWFSRQLADWLIQEAVSRRRQRLTDTSKKGRPTPKG
jgi:hypothetical protein